MKWLLTAVFLLSAFPVYGKEVSPAEKLTRRKCSACHTVPRPGKYTEEELLNAVQKHAKQLRGLSEEDKQMIVNYLRRIP